MFTPFDSHFLAQAERSRTRQQRLAEDVLAAEVLRSLAHGRGALVRMAARAGRLLRRGTTTPLRAPEEVAEQRV